MEISQKFARSFCFCQFLFELLTLKIYHVPKISASLFVRKNVVKFGFCGGIRACNFRESLLELRQPFSENWLFSRGNLSKGEKC